MQSPISMISPIIGSRAWLRRYIINYVKEWWNGTWGRATIWWFGCSCSPICPGWLWNSTGSRFLTFPTYDAWVCPKSSKSLFHSHPGGNSPIWGGRKYWMNCGKSKSCCNCKAVFTRYRHQLLLLLDEVDMPSRTQIRHMQLFFFHKMAAGGHFGWQKNHFRLLFSSFQINTQFFFKFFLQNGLRRPFCMTENHFRSHFSPFQIYTQFFFNSFFQNGRWWPFWIPIFAKIDRDPPPSIVCQWLHKIWIWSVHFWLSYRMHKLFHHIFTKSIGSSTLGLHLIHTLVSQ